MNKDQVDALKDSLNRLDSRLDAAERKDAAGYEVSHFGEWKVLEGIGPDGGKWLVVQGRGNKLLGTFANRAAAENYAQSKYNNT